MNFRTSNLILAMACAINTDEIEVYLNDVEPFTFRPHIVLLYPSRIL